jgi:hypothetical protein
MRLGVVLGACLLVLFWPLSADPAVTKVRWQVAYLGVERGVTVLGVQTESGTRQVTRAREAQRRVRAPLWSPSGRFLLFTKDYPKLRSADGLYLVDTAVRRTRRLTRTAPSAFALSRDGRIGYALDCVGASCEGQVHVVAQAGGEPRLVYRTEPKQNRLGTVVTALAWAPDGASLAFISEPRYEDGRCESCSSTLRVLGLNGEGSKVIAMSKPGTFLAVPVWSPDGMLIAFGQRCYTLAFGHDSYCDVAITTPQGTGERTLVSHDRKRPTPSGDIPFVWRPGTKEVAFAGWGSGVGIGLVNGVTGKLRFVARRGAHDLAFSSDGRRLGYLTKARGSGPVDEVRITSVSNGRLIQRRRLAAPDFSSKDLRLP